MVIKFQHNVDLKKHGSIQMYQDRTDAVVDRDRELVERAIKVKFPNDAVEDFSWDVSSNDCDV